MQKLCINGKHHRAAEAEAAVWDLVSGLLKDPERVRAGLDEMIEQERAGMRGDPDQEAASWPERLAEVEQERGGYLRFAAKGHSTDDELDETLAGSWRKPARRRRMSWRPYGAGRRPWRSLSGTGTLCSNPTPR